MTASRLCIGLALATTIAFGAAALSIGVFDVVRTAQRVDVKSPPPFADYGAADLTRLMTASGALGILKHCEGEGLYVSPASDAVFARLSAIFAPHMGAEDKMGVAAANLVRLIIQSAAFGIWLFDPDPDNEAVKVESKEITTEAQCREVEDYLLKAMSKGGILDVDFQAAPVPRKPTQGASL